MRELEKDIQRSILDYLELKRYFFWRNNSGAFKALRDDGRMGFYRFGQAGSPDIFVIVPEFDHHVSQDMRKSICHCIFGQVYGLEVKTSKGKQSDSQEAWQRGFEKAGGKYLLIRSLDEIMEVF